MNFRRLTLLPALAGALLGVSLLATPQSASADEEVYYKINCYNGECVRADSPSGPETALPSRALSPRTQEAAAQGKDNAGASLRPYTYGKGRLVKKSLRFNQSPVIVIGDNNTGPVTVVICNFESGKPGYGKPPAMNGYGKSFGTPNGWSTQGMKGIAPRSGYSQAPVSIDQQIEQDIEQSNEAFTNAATVQQIACAGNDATNTAAVTQTNEGTAEQSNTATQSASNQAKVAGASKKPYKPQVALGGRMSSANGGYQSAKPVR